MNPIVNPTTNQTQPTNGLNSIAIAKVLRSTSQFVLCPFCSEFVPTRAERSCSCASTCCFLCGFIPYLCFQVLREKDINCCNANHYCPNCNAIVHQYRAC